MAKTAQNKRMKVTSKKTPYPNGQEPTIIMPDEYESYRYAIGRPGSNKTCLVIGMNPSAACEKESDTTVTKVIKRVLALGYDGWIMTNLYPERSTDAKNMDEFDEDIARENLRQIIKLCNDYDIKEVWGCWGDQKHRNLTRAKRNLMAELIKNDIKVFYYGELTKKGNPRHPTPRYPTKDKENDGTGKRKYLQI